MYKPYHPQALSKIDTAKSIHKFVFCHVKACPKVQYFYNNIEIVPPPIRYLTDGRWPRKMPWTGPVWILWADTGCGPGAKLIIVNFKTGERDTIYPGRFNVAFS